MIQIAELLRVLLALDWYEQDLVPIDYEVPPIETCSRFEEDVQQADRVFTAILLEASICLDRFLLISFR